MKFGKPIVKRMWLRRAKCRFRGHRWGRSGVFRHREEPSATTARIYALAKSVFPDMDGPPRRQSRNVFFRCECCRRVTHRTIPPGWMFNMSTNEPGPWDDD